MSRKFLRPLFSFWEPMINDSYISKKAIPGGSQAAKEYARGQKTQQAKKHDPNQTFDDFFKDYYENTNNLRKEQKQFFEKHYPERVGKKFNPYETLGIDSKADLDKIRQAYRIQALKSHPKVDSSSDAQRRFSDLSRAYNQILQQKQRDDNGQDVSTKSLFEDFHNKMGDFDKDQAQQQQNQGKTSQHKKDTKQNDLSKSHDKINSESQPNKKQQTTKTINQNDNQQNTKNVQRSNQQKSSNILKGAQLYSQSSYFQFINGQRKLHITKMFQKDGRRIKVDRIEGQLPDGSIEVNQTLDDGKEVKNRKYVQGSSQKKQIKDK